MYELSNIEIFLRIGVAIICGSAIGLEREVKGHDAGLRTHMLVSVGSAIIAMVQVKASYEIIKMIMDNPDLASVLTTDFIRLTAQIVSGIGFLGAGTIIVTKRNVSGLTTAASIWAIAGIGIAVGMGYYFLAIVSTVAVLAVLRIIKRLFGAPNVRLINIKYTGKETQIALKDYFVEHNIKVFSEEYSLDFSKDDLPTYSNYYSIGLADERFMSQLINDIIDIENVHHISTLKEK
ncbi:MgtC/SapB family protein [Desemzia sp. RIT804]|uniref:MgtC/SapB family protein n=1 Tax=Desemzia sp. RIT 804 TaxID=2810209 RepID=UPI00194FA681|nr:MgtC/SapB family protein [Desemzia sp. RIT 804]MBM6614541.1 MgtC/SapB family protein [Desemzia sp. RIT 804]